MPGSRARSEYTLTPAGLDLLPVLAALTDWGDRHLAAGDGRTDVVYRHTGCGDACGRSCGASAASWSARPPG